ncbi:hypothetical protein KFU94_01765 [Chloroflexi bacterium TSY]|nr:hypothetical protein [Chloroflexi bacterium TSY]
MNESNPLISLRTILADLYPTENDTRRVVADAGLNARNIEFSSHATNNWHAILVEAQNSSQIDALMDVALREYPKKQGLKQAYDEYRTHPGLLHELADDAYVTQPVQKPPLYVNVPSMPNHFVGRDELLEEMVSLLLSGNHLALSAEGLPGVGKTTLAVALAHHQDVLDYFKDGVLWGSLGKQPDVMSQLTHWANALEIDVSELRNVTERALTIKNAIGQRSLLLVIDDAWDLDAAKLLRCGGPNCCHILTTRNQSIARDFSGKNQIETVPVLDDETAYQLLAELAEEACAAAPDVARKLVKSIGGLPLTLELLGGYLATAQHSRYPELAKVSLSQMLSPQKRLQLATQRLGTTNKPEVSLQETIMLSLEDESLPKETVATFYALGAFAPKPVSFDMSAAEAVAETNLVTLAILANRNLLDDSDLIFAQREGNSIR